MIRLKKLEEPQILKENAKDWTEEYLSYIRRGGKIPEQVKKRYADKTIKKQLMEETHGKCAYCESKFSHVCPGDIEHILPKNPDAHPELYVTWSNLTVACEICNRSGKKDYNNDNEPLINPYVDDISDMIFSFGSILYPFQGNRRGLLTINILDLNRVSLIERRREAINKLNLLITVYSQESNIAYKELLLSQIREEVADDKEFSFVLKAFCRCNDIEV